MANGLRPFPADWAENWIKCNFFTHNLKNFFTGLFLVLPAYGRMACSAQNFPPKEFYFCPLGKTYHFLSEATQTDLSGQTFLPHVYLLPQLIIYSISAQICHPCQVLDFLFTIEINMTSASLDDDYNASACSSVGSESESEALTDLEKKLHPKASKITQQNKKCIASRTRFCPHCQ